MKFHHLGIATEDIKRSIELCRNLGFISGEIIRDEIQKVNICFMRKKGHPLIELIEPIDDKSPVRNIVDKMGTSLYHMCYSTKNIYLDIKKLKKENFLMVVKPVEAIAFNSKKVCFCYNKDFGLLELVEIL
jgi:methylmalonyl-CoA/ethylmalonyl-CoA epimerase